MKVKTLFLMAGTIGAGVALTQMIRGRQQEQKARRGRRRTIAGVVGASVALTKLMRKQNAHKA
jgi:hypothetical protein